MAVSMSKKGAEAMKIRLVISVTGKVQGVSFRKQTARLAEELGVRGWMMNQSDGSVQGCVEGDIAAVEALFTWCSVGPEPAMVDLLTCDIQPYTGEFRDFLILHEKEKAA
jgi:acylphosphatase